MAHFARIDENNIVQQVVVVPNEQEHRGSDFLSIDLGLGGTWIRTSYNGSVRKMFAGVGYVYNPNLDIFLPPKPYKSWILNETNGEWESPVKRPEVSDGEISIWDEESLNWKIEKLPILETLQ